MTFSVCLSVFMHVSNMELRRTWYSLQSDNDNLDVWIWGFIKEYIFINRNWFLVIKREEWTAIQQSSQLVLCEWGSIYLCHNMWQGEAGIKRPKFLLTLQKCEWYLFAVYAHKQNNHTQPHTTIHKHTVEDLRHMLHQRI